MWNPPTVVTNPTEFSIQPRGSREELVAVTGLRFKRSAIFCARALPSAPAGLSRKAQGWRNAPSLGSIACVCQPRSGLWRRLAPQPASGLDRDGPDTQGCPRRGTTLGLGTESLQDSFTRSSPKTEGSDPCSKNGPTRLARRDFDASALAVAAPGSDSSRSTVHRSEICAKVVARHGARRAGARVCDSQQAPHVVTR